MPYSGKATVKIYNYLGQLTLKAFDKEVIKNQVYKIALDGSQMYDGIYFVVLKTESETKVNKIIVSK